jgi:hypothetical protein
MITLSDPSFPVKSDRPFVLPPTRIAGKED